MALTKNVSLSKHHGLCNDFLIAIEPEVNLTSEHAVAWCDRRAGIGADGLIISERKRNKVWSMLLLNADGSRAEISGNGIRCLAQAIAQHTDLEIAEAAELTLEIHSDNGPYSVVLTADKRSNTIQAKVNMGAAKTGPAPSDKWQAAGVDIISQGGIDMGNPHLVAQVAEVSSIDLAVVGPLIEADYLDGLNVHVVTVDDKKHVRLHTWERGAGLTQACGSGACASAYQLRQWGLVDTEVEVLMPGGSAVVEVSDTIFLRGPATFIAQIEVPG